MRSGLRFRRTFELAKQRAVGEEDWYPYDCFTNLFPIEQLRRNAGLSLADLTGNQPVLGLGTADGALAFLFESLGHRVHACDHAGTNRNRMQGVRRLAERLQSEIEIEDLDLDGVWNLQRQFGLPCSSARFTT